ncbi:hypothetical protein [Pararobbsia silviterrae]|uniref:hypothetical protein n=1 Tax=Pararobbsia silviterrae TaxID=1792498 RepID=UPI0011C38554|nr:hypothetical protein [Pararobbsia silviterrae]
MFAWEALARKFLISCFGVPRTNPAPRALQTTIPCTASLDTADINAALLFGCFVEARILMAIDPPRQAFMRIIFCRGAPAR